MKKRFLYSNDQRYCGIAIINEIIIAIIMIFLLKSKFESIKNNPKGTNNARYGIKILKICLNSSPIPKDNRSLKLKLIFVASNEGAIFVGPSTIILSTNANGSPY